MDANFEFPKGSAILRAVSNVWPLVVRGVRWSIGDGTTARFWRDIWTHSPRLLLCDALGPIPEHQLEWKVCDYVDEAGRWKWNLFGHLVSASSLLRLAATLPPSGMAGPDTMYWGFSENGLFTTKSAYASLLPYSPTRDRAGWRAIWKWTGPQRVRQFLWLAAQEKLLTNVERHRRHITRSTLCPLCEQFPESTLHCLRDCVGAKQIWMTLIPTKNHSAFFSMPLRDWIVQNLQNGLSISVVAWETIFGVTVWQIWKGRNDKILSDMEFIVSNKIRDVLSFVHGIQLTRSIEHHLGGFGAGRGVHLIRWTAPAMGTIKINTDGSLLTSSGMASAGGLARDADGRYQLYHVHHKNTNIVDQYTQLNQYPDVLSKCVTHKTSVRHRFDARLHLSNNSIGWTNFKYWPKAELGFRSRNSTAPPTSDAENP
ncbi:Polynucleotidyl transferase- ribonuclease H-like superfamily protein [Striga hermonthica]|uniref:Polynucleotidyl transferase- ribonuclease H-like superfamily protein n=1 Tax=Striga hermonthica TaxID=68872 RepID=A0A9N7RDA3_STRHE|nr:Polynucleotidyl transferase- ribonuclease H-like superfamily protein [Striga hermonthica]